MVGIFTVALLAATFQSAAAKTLQIAEIGVRRNGKVEVVERDTDPIRRARIAAEDDGNSKALTSAEIDEDDDFRPKVGAFSPSGLAEGASTRFDKAIPGMDDQAVSRPCLGPCAEAAKKGIMFIGDSTIRRLYIRFVSRLGRLTNEQSEMLQDNAKQWSHHAGNVPLSQFRDATGEVPFAYTKGGMKVRFEWDSQYFAANITKKLKDAQSQSYGFAYVGLPLAHMLHWDGSPSLACESGPKFANELEGKFKELVELEDSSQVRVVFGNGVPYANGDRLLNLTCEGLGKMKVEKCTPGVCDWIRCQSHLEKANAVYKHAFDQMSKPHMRLADIAGATVQSKLWRYRTLGLSDGGVHYKYPLLDEQLDLILKEMMA